MDCFLSVIRGKENKLRIRMTFPVCALQVSCCHELCVYPELILSVDVKGTWVSGRVLPGWGWGEGASVPAGRLTLGRTFLFRS